MNLRHPTNVALRSRAISLAVLTSPAAGSLKVGAAAPALSASGLKEAVS
jgi:hypothetical protein